MINERPRPIWRLTGMRGLRAVGKAGWKGSMSGIAAFLIAVGGVSLFFFWLMGRADRIRDRRRAYADSAASDTSGISSGNGGFSLLDWFGRSSSSSSDNSCTSSSPSFFSSGDSSCSDGGGGGGDSGGGGD